ncbi:MAG TPA: TetR/AcrR family transcriptional regulator [Thermoleophilaceae bacterium]|nr:TetR/AcrR family transcriptional regulator [Thermoleophilaceae bacterium]
MGIAAARPHADGRTARSERTRLAVVDALLELLDDGEVRPTAERIAGRAGVSERSLFQHFHDREALFEAVAQRQYDRVVPTLSPIDADLPLDERLDAFVEQRCRLLETLSGVRRGALLMEPESTTIANWLRRARSAKAAEARRVFARELDARAPAERAPLAAALVAACSWTAWECYRLHQELSAGEAAAAMRTGLAALVRAGD